MARPYNKDFRADILGAFDAQPIQTITQVVNYLGNIADNENTEDKLKPSYQSTRNMMRKMVKEGLLTELPKRGDKNQSYFAKAIFKNVTRFASYEGDNVSLKEFIHTLITDVNPELVDSNAMKAIKVWMLDILGASVPESYADKNRAVPNPEQLYKKLNELLAQTRQFHAFVKSFVDADIFSPVAQERLATEFKSTCVDEHAVIVDRAWMHKEV